VGCWKLLAVSHKLQARVKPQASSPKPQASSLKPQASSFKPQASSLKLQASSFKPQASSHKGQAVNMGIDYTTSNYDNDNKKINT
jgi:hypothetical protein